MGCCQVSSPDDVEMRTIRLAASHTAKAYPYTVASETTELLGAEELLYSTYRQIHQEEQY